MDGLTPADSARVEAWEEAGVTGRVAGACLGVFSYAKGVGDLDDLSCVAMLYPIEVVSLAKKYPEAGQRRRRWLSRKKAAQIVGEIELARLILDFDPRKVHRRA